MTNPEEVIWGDYHGSNRRDSMVELRTIVWSD